MSMSWMGVAARLAMAVVVSVLASGPTFAQSVSARIEGVVVDSTGATVPGASVTATAQATNASRTVVTDTVGNYVITPLQTGSYKVAVQMSGFKPQETRVTLTVNQVARLDFKIQPGGISEVVEARARGRS